MSPLRSAARRAAGAVLGSPWGERAVVRMAPRRGRSIVLLWHRISPAGPAEHEVVKTVPLDRFEAQLDVLTEIGTVVPLRLLDEAAPNISDRPLFALTFDDDDWRHSRHVLPVLKRRNLPASFFLSGRWVHGLGPYWWELLEQEIHAKGRAAVARRYGFSPDTSAPHLGRALTGTPLAQELVARARRPTSAPPTEAIDAHALVAAGMEIGFHTIDHQVLPALGDHELAQALRIGREELSSALGVPLERFAYPHGLTDGRVEAAAASSGYRSSWTTSRKTARPGDAPMRRGRWDLGHRPLGEMRAMLLRGLARPAP